MGGTTVATYTYDGDGYRTKKVVGTAVGDGTATTLHLGFFASGVLFAVVILLPLVAWRLGVNSVVTFWVAYVLTRPLGASFADWFGKPHSFGAGLGYGDGTVTGIALVIFILLVTLQGKGFRYGHH